MALPAVFGRGRGEAGYTLTELVAVLAILTTVLTALTTLFMSGARAELDANRRFQAQQDARLAVDRMRREVRCATGVTVTNVASISVALPAGCPRPASPAETVVYDVQQVSEGRYRLRRAGATVADHLTENAVFGYVAPSPDTRGRLTVTLAVNANPSEGWKTWRLATDIVLRNTTRS